VYFVIKFSFRRSAFVMALALTIPAITGIAAHAAAAQPLPSNCQEIHNHNHHARDGKYTLYDNGYIFTVYCDDMKGNPQAYINLAETGTDANYSQYTAGGASPGTNVRTTFTKLRIDPATLTVDIGNLTFASSTGRVNHSNSGNIVTSMPYGVAMSCAAPQDAIGTGNINLRGTPFAVASSFTVAGFEPAGSAFFSPDNQVVNLRGGGYCGWITPSPAMYDPFNPQPGEYHLKLTCVQKPASVRRHLDGICVHV
jgi:GON domain